MKCKRTRSCLSGTLMLLIEGLEGAGEMCGGPAGVQILFSYHTHTHTHTHTLYILYIGCCMLTPLHYTLWR